MAVAIPFLASVGLEGYRYFDGLRINPHQDELEAGEAIGQWGRVL